MTKATILAFMAGMLAGNYQGDQLTLQDCARSGIAEMAGGGTISCQVTKP